MHTTIAEQGQREVEITFSSRLEYLETDDDDIHAAIDAAIPERDGLIEWDEEPAFLSNGRVSIKGRKLAYAHAPTTQPGYIAHDGTAICGVGATVDECREDLAREQEKAGERAMAAVIRESSSTTIKAVASVGVPCEWTICEASPALVAYVRDHGAPMPCHWTTQGGVAYLRSELE